ncbi:FecR family protein [Sphingobacterium pedocola]|uniref:FecR family protein n=1 Tax=Sphingobacterium pedocola TaxID=2082722 RepID=A0ABR9TBB9_9SPHI|nr:FecR domain-containing protein [Sphingobacterium pedocola]MBE8722643.1 hypothetical protein [Sphingobacterium pedocola]
MEEPNHRIDSYLLKRYATGQCTEEEEAFIDSWYVAHKRSSSIGDIPQQQLEKDLANVWNHLEAHIQEDRPITNWKKWLSAAAAVLIIGASTYLYWPSPDRSISVEHSETVYEPVDIGEVHSVRYAKVDVEPAQSQAILILSNGERVHINKNMPRISRTDHTVGIDLSHSDHIVYQSEADETSSTQALTNTLVVPKGSVYTLVLADGTKVSLNADSKLVFPIQFNRKKREVYLEGEAYFEVSKKSITDGDTALRQEFIVHAGPSSVHVLGTKFNVKAYKGDNTSSITLEEGAIALTTPRTASPLRLKPGQRATNHPNELVVEEIALHKELSWKNGDFYFEAATIQDIMRQISRWYNVEIQYLSEPDQQQYISTISRTKTLKEVLEILETTTGSRFDIQQKGNERRVMVIP